jgi:TolB-like protein
MGEVYRARDERLVRDVAIKVLPAQFVADPDRLRRFAQEARAASALNHPNILVVHDVGSHEGAPFLVTELLAGQTLRERLRAGDLPPRKAVEIVAQVATGLAAAHERGIIHRDLKPENLFLTDDGVAKILDFGLAKFTRGDAGSRTPTGTAATVLIADPAATGRANDASGLTRPGALLGTLAYMAPEQVRGLAVDHRADIFALGCVLYELIAGRPPFARATPAETLGAILADDSPPLPERVDGAPPGVARTIAHCLEKRPADRFQSVRDLAFSLRESLTDPGQQAPPIVNRVTAAWRSRRRWTTRALLGLAAGALAIVAAGQLVRDQVPWRTTGVEPKRIVVTVLENETGDRSLDPLGRMAADWITQGLLQVQGLDVVPSTSLLFTQPASRLVEGSGSEPWRQVVKETGAGTVVSGAYYRQGGTLRFQVEVVDVAGGSLMLALDPVVGAVKDPMPAIDELRQRLMGALAAREEATHYLVARQAPPLYDAYREFIAGFEIFMTDEIRALQHFQRAGEIDSTFYAPLLYEAYLHHTAGNVEQAERVLRRLTGKREQLAPLTRAWLDAITAFVAHRYPEALQVLRGAQALAPRDPLVNHWIGYLALCCNRPRETVETLERFGSRPWSGHPLGASWVELHCHSLHMLGAHERELVEARRGNESFPDRLAIAVREVAALAALGRLMELDEVVAQSRTSAFTGTTCGEVMLEAAMELRAHGHREASLVYARQAVTWYRERLSGTPEPSQTHLNLMHALRWAEEWDAAAELCRARLQAAPDDVVALGTLGAIAARRGDRDEARRFSAALGELAGPYLFGSAVYRRACIAALLGDQPAAIELLRRAFADGVAYGSSHHRQIDFEHLWADPAFTELLRPRE